MFDFLFRPQDVLMAAAVVFALLLIVIVFMGCRTPRTAYEQLPSILTKAEQQFYKALSSALDGRVIITCKVRIADLLKVRRHKEHKGFWEDFKNISQKHLDFVLVDKSTFTTIAAIELDDKSHSKFESRATDNFKNRIMHQAGLPLYRFKARRRYDRAEILKVLTPSLNAEL